MATAAISGSFQTITVSSSAVGLTPPTSGAPSYALIQCETNNVRWRDDGTNPTAAVGQLLSAGGILKYDGPLSLLKFIRVSADATLSVSYYSV
jgi:hypothetical protein